MKYLNVFGHPGSHQFQLTVLGHSIRSECYPTEEEAAFFADVAKHYLRETYRMDKPRSLDPEIFAVLSHRHSVNLSNPFPSLPQNVQFFFDAHNIELSTFRESQPGPSPAQLLRESPLFRAREDIQEWVLAYERAELDAEQFATIDANSFFLRLKVVASSLTAVIKSLRLAVRMHRDATNPHLVDRAAKLSTLGTYLEQTLEYVVDLNAGLRAEQARVESAVANLEANRPNLV